MGSGYSSLHVGNASSKIILARVTQEKTRIKEIEGALGLTKSCSIGENSASSQLGINVSGKVAFEHSLDISGYARIGPEEALEFDLPSGKKNTKYVTALTVEESNVIVFCYNYCPPYGKSVIITSTHTVVLSERQAPTKSELKPRAVRDSALPADGDMFKMAALMDVKGKGLNEDQEAVITEGDKMCWVTAEGIRYTPSMAVKVHKQSDVDNEAKTLLKTGNTGSTLYAKDLTLNISIKNKRYCTSERPPTAPNGNQIFQCPYCDVDELERPDFVEHCLTEHKNSKELVVCPICSSMSWGDPMLVSSNFMSHLQRHKFDYEKFVDREEDEESMLTKALAASQLDQ